MLTRGLGFLLMLYLAGVEFAYGQKIGGKNVCVYTSNGITIPYCCPGWIKLTTDSSPDCNIAICQLNCQNGGTCTGPNTCTCTKGWEGQYCSKKAATTGGTVCVNGISCQNGGTCVKDTNGNNKCNCAPGWDGDDCRNDVDECLSITGCDRCINTQGSFRCECNTGRVLDSSGKNCKDKPTTSPWTTKGPRDYDILNGLRRNGAHVVYDTNFKDVTYRVSFTEVYFYKVTTKGFFGTNYRRVSGQRTNSRIATKYIEYRVYRCATYWEREPGSDECNIPKCDFTCQNGGKCVSRDGVNRICECPKTYRGTACQIDVNECITGNNKCQQICHNSSPGYTCSCRKGYVLQADGKSCQDINECASTPCKCKVDDGVCKASCTNTDGGYKCNCPKGYNYTSSDGCKDFNECIWNNNLCEGICKNTPGSYSCTCFSGYRVRTDGKCEDIDECQTNNGGCSDICANVKGTYFCKCPQGKYLLTDRKTCQNVTKDIRTKTICETSGFGDVDCTAGYQLEIISAFYGRAQDDICPTDKKGVVCGDTNAMSKLASECFRKGSSSCVIGFFGIQRPKNCPAGVPLYFTINYRCK